MDNSNLCYPFLCNGLVANLNDKMWRFEKINRHFLTFGRSCLRQIHCGERPRTPWRGSSVGFFAKVRLVICVNI